MRGQMRQNDSDTKKQNYINALKVGLIDTFIRDLEQISSTNEREDLLLDLLKDSSLTPSQKMDLFMITIDMNSDVVLVGHNPSPLTKMGKDLSEEQLTSIIVKILEKSQLNKNDTLEQKREKIGRQGLMFDLLSNTPQVKLTSIIGKLDDIQKADFYIAACNSSLSIARDSDEDHGVIETFVMRNGMEKSAANIVKAFEPTLQQGNKLFADIHFRISKFSENDEAVKTEPQKLSAYTIMSIYNQDHKTPITELAKNELGNLASQVHKEIIAQTKTPNIKPSIFKTFQIWVERMTAQIRSKSKVGRNHKTEQKRQHIAQKPQERDNTLRTK
jgi:hypothetical protein